MWRSRLEVEVSAETRILGQQGATPPVFLMQRDVLGVSYALIKIKIKK